MFIVLAYTLLALFFGVAPLVAICGGLNFAFYVAAIICGLIAFGASLVFLVGVVNKDGHIMLGSVFLGGLLCGFMSIPLIWTTLIYRGIEEGGNNNSLMFGVLFMLIESMISSTARFAVSGSTKE